MEFQSVFEKIANKLFSKYQLVVNGHAYQIAELEFYLNSEQHPDIFTHSHVDQRCRYTPGSGCQGSHNQWYFHKTGNSYKGGSYKGLDMTFGNDGYGGILFRALFCPETQTYTEGPCKVVDLILSLTAHRSVAELVADEAYDGNVFRPNLLYLRKMDRQPRQPIQMYSSARVGLRLNNKQQIPFVVKPYRFVCYPKRVRKGRQYLVLALHYNQLDPVAITGCTRSQCEKWIGKFEEGIQGDATADSYFKRTLKVDEFSVFYGVLLRVTQ